MTNEVLCAIIHAESEENRDDSRPCMCGDSACSSCGVAQGTLMTCPSCGEETEDGCDIGATEWVCSMCANQYAEDCEEEEIDADEWIDGGNW